MGQPCYFGDDELIAPDCTDNFQIVQPMFSAYGYEWHSVEQALQALKFPEGSIGRKHSLNCTPDEMERSGEYGKRVWMLGQRNPPNFSEGVMRKGGNLEKVKVKSLLNLSKQDSNDIYKQ